MTANNESKKNKTNIIQFKPFKKNDKQMSSTIAAIIAVNINHPENISPEDYLIDNIELNENIELVAFEDALDDLIDSSNLDNSKNSKNFVNDA